MTIKDFENKLLFILKYGKGTKKFAESVLKQAREKGWLSPKQKAAVNKIHHAIEFEKAKEPLEENGCLCECGPCTIDKHEICTSYCGY